MKNKAISAAEQARNKMIERRKKPNGGNCTPAANSQANNKKVFDEARDKVCLRRYKYVK